jgi:hypothetical protein
MSYNSKYTGREVEELLDKTNELNVSAVDSSIEVDDVVLEYATIQYVDTAITSAITTALNTEV